MSRRILASGELYSNGKINERWISNGSELKLQATGNGSYQLIGKLTENSEYKLLSLIRMSDFAVKDIVTDSEIYTCDVSGLYSVSVRNVAGFSNIWATVICED